MKLLLFGMIGSGKSFIGEFLQREFGITYHDADRDLPESVEEAIRMHKPITGEMRDAFVERIIERIRLLSQ
jgi:shikimate kinase